MAVKSNKPETEKKLPVRYSLELVDKICQEIEVSDKGLIHILQGAEYPTVTSFLRWLADPKNEEARNMYARAKRLQADFIADQLIAIADDSSNDYEITDDGRVIENKEWVNRSRLRVDTRKWILAKLNPRKYGDKIETEHSGEIKIIPMQVQVSTEDAKNDLDLLNG